MTTLSLPFPSGRAASRSSIFHVVSEFFAGIREGISAAKRYKTLAYKNDDELARIGLKRENLVRTVVFGRS